MEIIIITFQKSLQCTNLQKCILWCLEITKKCLIWICFNREQEFKIRIIAVCLLLQVFVYVFSTCLHFQLLKYVLTTICLHFQYLFTFSVVVYIQYLLTFLIFVYIISIFFTSSVFVYMISICVYFQYFFTFSIFFLHYQYLLTFFLSHWFTFCTSNSRLFWLISTTMH